MARTKTTFHAREGTAQSKHSLFGMLRVRRFLRLCSFERNRHRAPPKGRARLGFRGARRPRAAGCCRSNPMCPAPPRESSVRAAGGRAERLVRGPGLGFEGRGVQVGIKRKYLGDLISLLRVPYRMPLKQTAKGGTKACKGGVFMVRQQLKLLRACKRAMTIIAYQGTIKDRNGYLGRQQPRVQAFITHALLWTTRNTHPHSGSQKELRLHDRHRTSINELLTSDPLTFGHVVKTPPLSGEEDRGRPRSTTRTGRRERRPPIRIFRPRPTPRREQEAENVLGPVLSR